jgi:glycosyltransferase involved in cell wall biosynthesis
MKKVIIISTSSDIGGGPMHILGLMKNLKTSYRFYAAIPSSGSMAEEIIENSYDNFDIPQNRFSLKVALKLAKYIHKNDIRIIHSHGKGASTYARFLKLLFRKLILVHTLHGIHFKNYGALKRLLYRAFELLTVHINDRLVFVSKSEKLKLENFLKCKVKNWTIIPNGTAIRLDEAALLKKISGKAAQTNIIFLGRLDPIKNVMAVLDLARALETTGLSFKISVCGGGEQKNEFVSNAKLHNSMSNVEIKYLGQVRNGPEVLKQFDVLFNCSISEGLPISLLEAMSLGVLCLASDVTGNRDIINHNANGLLYPFGNMESAKNELMTVLNNKKKYDDMVMSAWRTHRSHFTDHKCYDQIRNLYAAL